MGKKENWKTKQNKTKITEKKQNKIWQNESNAYKKKLMATKQNWGKQKSERYSFWKVTDKTKIMHIKKLMATKQKWGKQKSERYTFWKVTDKMKVIHIKKKLGRKQKWKICIL